MDIGQRSKRLTYFFREKEKSVNAPLIKIYIVDDNQSFGRSLKRLLNARGISADHFCSAQAFIDSVDSDQKGIAILDIHMPECDGFVLMDKMDAMGYDMPVIVITGYAKADTENIAMKRGAVGFLRKPFNENSFLNMIETQMENMD